MSNALAWPQQLASAIKKYKASDLGSSRKAFNAKIAETRGNESLSDADVDLLAKAQVLLESWLQPVAPVPDEALSQWNEFYGAAKDSLPSVVISALLARFPKYKDAELDWSWFIATCQDNALFDVVVRQRLIGKKSFKRLASNHATELYASPLLDSLAKERLPSPRPVWEEFARGAMRPTGLSTSEQLLLRSYASDKAADADKWFVSLLVKSDFIRRVVIRAILTSPGLSLRLTRKLLDAALPRIPLRKESYQARIAELGVSLLEAAIEEADSSGPHTQTAIAIIGMFRCAQVMAPASLFEPIAKRLGTIPPSIIENRVGAALRQMEAGREMSEAADIFPISGAELYGAVRGYFAAITAGIGTSTDAVTASAQLERYKGRRDVIDSILPILDSDTSAGRVHDTLEAALFNAGVRKYGEAGERVICDFRVHRTDSPLVVPGDRVTIVRPGRLLGDDSEGIVLAKALVEPD